MIEKLINTNGITIKQLKEFVKNLPEVDNEIDEDFEVWIATSENGSKVAKGIWQLNKGDIIFEI